MKLTSALTLAGVLAAQMAHATPTFVNGIAIPGATGDQFGTSPNNGRVGFFSDLYYDPNRNEWWGVSDRGPGGGTLSYDTRVQQFTISVDSNTGTVSSFNIVQTVKFTDAGNPLNGLAPNPTNILGRSFDPEGFVVHPKTGNFLVSDEYGPALREFNRSGQLVRNFVTPANLIPRDSVTGIPNFAGDPATNPAGKRTNRGFEGLAITPDGKFAYAMLQSPTLDEGGGANGRFTRIVKFDTATGTAVAQYAYLMDRSGQGQGTSGLVALNHNEFLVLERNNRGVGVGADFATADKSVYKINLSSATNVTNIALPSSGTTLPAGVVAVTKSAQFLDLDANTLAALGNKPPEKLEGLTIGPRLNDGSFLLVVGTDNDYSVTQNGSNVQFDVYFRFSDADPYAGSIQCPLGLTTGCFLTSNNATSATPTSDYALLPGLLYAYKTPTADLAGYIAPASGTVPEASTWMLLLSGLAIFGGWKRHRKLSN